MLITIRDKDVTIVSRSCKEDKEIAVFLALAFQYAERYATELEFKLTAKEYQEIVDQLHEYI